MHESRLVTILVEDVSRSIGRHREEESASSKRNLIRTIFAAIEGIVWIYREFVQNSLSDLEILTEQERAALAERIWSVSETGKISGSPRFISLAASIRLATRMAQRANNQVDVDFGNPAWMSFKLAIRTRHRITHPKTLPDIEVSDQDVEQCLIGFYWLMDTVTTVMDQTVMALRDHSLGMREILEQLQAGDPGTWAEYQAALQSRQGGD